MSIDIELVYSLWCLEKFPPERLPEVACEALEEGLDGDALRKLAGLIRPTRADVGRLFDDAYIEIGLQPLSEHDVQQRLHAAKRIAALGVAREVSELIISMQLDIYEGWRRIWGAYVEAGEPDELKSFFEFAPDPDGVISVDSEFQGRVLAAAELFSRRTN